MSTKTAAARIPTQPGPLDIGRNLIRADCGHWEEEGLTSALWCIDQVLCSECTIEHERYDHCPDCTERLRQYGDE
jgi:hypothetical protein